MKKLISLILCLCLALSAFTVFAEESTAEETAPVVSAKYIKNVNFLKSLGLGDYTEKNPQDYITREEFASVLYNLLGDTETYSFNIVPMDLSAESEHYNAIGAMYTMGIMNGVSSTQFNPKGNITVYQASKCMLTLLGYDSAVKEGGYPQEYIRIGQKLKLYTGVPMVDKNMTWEMAITFVMNSLDAAYVELGGVVGDELLFTTENKETILTIFHDIHISEGRVTDNGVTTISGADSISRETMVIGKVTGLINNDSLRDFLGRDVKFYYSNKDGIKRILYIEPLKSYNNTIVIKADDLEIDSEEFTKTNVVYYSDKKKMNAKVDPLADAIYNGKSFPTFMSKDLKIKAGQLTLADTNGDALYDLILIDEYVDVLISGIDTTNECVYDYFGQNYSYSDDDFVTIYDKDMNVIDASQFKTDSVVSIYKSKDGECVKYVLSTLTVTGDVEMVDERDGKTYVTIGGVDYSYSESLLQKAADGYSGIYLPELGINVNAYLNFENKIVDTNVTKKEYMYAFCLEIGEEKISYKKKTTALRVVTETGEEAILLASDKIRINQADPTVGINLLNHKDFYDPDDGAFLPQLIKVKLNSKGEVNWLETATTVSTAPLGFEEGKFTLNSSKDNGNNNGNNCYDGRYASKSNTVVFQVKRDSTYKDAADITIVKNGPYYASAKYYDANELWEAGAIVVWDNSSTIYYETNPILIEKVAKTKNEDEEFVYNIQGWYGYRQWSWVEAEPGLIDEQCPGGLKAGDVILVIFDDYGRIKTAKKVISLNEKPDPFYMNIRGTYPYVDHGVVFGNVCAKNSRAFSLTTDGGKSVYTQANNDTSVFVYDVNDKSVTKVLWKDIPVSAVRVGDSYEITDEDTRVCVVRSRRRTLCAIIVKY